MKNRKKLLLTGLVLAIGIQLTAANPNEVLKKAREDYYRQQKNELNAKKEEERLAKLKKKEEEKAAREAKLAEQKRLAEEEKEKIKIEKQNSSAEEKINRKRTKEEARAQKESVKSEIKEEVTEVETTIIESVSNDEKAVEAKKAELEAKKKRAAALKVLQKWRRTGSIK